MFRKIAISAFVAAVLTAFTTGTSPAADTSRDQGTTQDRSMSRDRSMSKDRSERSHDRSAASRERSDMKGKEISLDLAPAPKVSTQAKGETEFKFEDDGKTLAYKIEVDNIKDVTQAHVHMVKPDGSAGEVVAPLFPAQSTGALPSGQRTDAAKTGKEGGMKQGEFSGKLTEGTITDQQLTGPLRGKTTQDLYEMLRTGKAGVNVHTKANPVGEIWGTSQAGSSSDKK